MKKILIIAIIAAITFSCKKFDTPPLTYPTEGGAITVDSLRQLYQAGGPIVFTNDMDLYGTITMDENDGNVYKSIFLQDKTGAINVRMSNGGGVYEGDSVRISLKGCYLNQFGGVQQLDSVNADWNIVKLAVDKSFPPEITTIDQITTAKESQLIQLNNVQVVQWQLNNTFADKPNLQEGDILLEDANSNTILVRTSGYASFADQTVPQGSGTIVLIVSHFNGELQMLIRSFNEINMNGPRFTGLAMVKDFNDDDFTSGGWSEYQVTPSIAVWETSSAGGAPNPFVQISNFNGSTNEVTDNWLISPSIDLSGYLAPKFSFDNAYNYAGAALEIYISNDYVSGNPNSATWTNLTGFANWSGGSWVFVNSGDIDISGFTNSNVHVAFRYQGSGTDGSTWELDNILIKG
jgi:Family of unknown function (DUF5689)